MGLDVRTYRIVSEGDYAPSMNLKNINRDNVWRNTMLHIKDIIHTIPAVEDNSECNVYREDVMPYIQVRFSLWNRFKGMLNTLYESYYMLSDINVRQMKRRPVNISTPAENNQSGMEDYMYGVYFHVGWSVIYPNLTCSKGPLVGGPKFLLNHMPRCYKDFMKQYYAMTIMQLEESDKLEKEEAHINKDDDILAKKKEKYSDLYTSPMYEGPLSRKQEQMVKDKKKK